MKFGMNLLLWTDSPWDEATMPVVESLARMGFDGVELPIFSGGPSEYAALGRRLDDVGLERTAITVRNVEDDPISADPAIRRAAIDATRHAIDCAAASGARLMAGPFYAAIGQFSGAPPTSREWDHAVEHMQAAADHAGQAGLGLSLEFLNRFEIYLLNTAADTARFVRDVGRPNVGVHYDTFHANIEEKNAAEAIAHAANAITHVHISENDRGTPGRGQVRWEETWQALAAIGYDGWLTIEAFGHAVPSLAAATRIWRPLFESEEQLAREGLAFMREAWTRHAGAR